MSRVSPALGTLRVSFARPQPLAVMAEAAAPPVAPRAAGTPCCAVPPCAPGPEPAPPLGLRRLHDMRPGGAQLPRPEGEVAPAALENGVHGGFLSAEQKAEGGGRGGGGGAPLPPGSCRTALTAAPAAPEPQPRGVSASRATRRGALAVAESRDASGRALPAGRGRGSCPSAQLE